LYRVAQEVFNNVIKHSRAKRVTVQLLFFNEEVTLTIEDDGQGFVREDGLSMEGVGLQNIKNRIISIGGVVQFDSHENYGTLITVEVDLKLGLFDE